MAKFPGADWRGPVPNMNEGEMVFRVRGLVLHIEQGTEAGTNAWFHNPAAEVSAHFGNPKSGKLDQWVDTADKAWTIVAGNRYWISVENEGDTGESLTVNQLENCAKLLAWLHTTHDVPLQLANSPNDRGLGYHAMGGGAWGGHSDCPGHPIINQREHIIERAKQIVEAADAAERGHPPLAKRAEQIAKAAKSAKG